MSKPAGWSIVRELEGSNEKLNRAFVGEERVAPSFRQIENPMLIAISNNSPHLVSIRSFVLSLRDTQRARRLFQFVARTIASLDAFPESVWSCRKQSAISNLTTYCILFTCRLFSIVAFHETGLLNELTSIQHEWRDKSTENRRRFNNTCPKV